MNVRPSRPLLSCLLVLVALVLGCDPKLIGTDTGSDGTGGADTGGSGAPTVVTPEALVTGNMIAFETDLISLALSVAADFDSSSAPFRSFDTACATVTSLSPPDPSLYQVAFDGCVDANGTAYRGGGVLRRVNGQDGFTYLPLFDADLLRATNETNDNYNFTTLSPASTAGSLVFTFQRDGSNNVTGVEVSNFLRNGVRGDTVTLSFTGVTYSGALGSHGAHPDAGSTVRIVWDGVGLFDVEFQANGMATYTMQGGTYEVDLDTGDVQVSGA